MITQRMTAETAGARLTHRFGLSGQGQLRALAKSETQKCQHHAKAESVDLRMIDLNLFRGFDAMMLHRSVCKASQMLSVTPSAVSHALSRLRRSIGDELFIPTESGMQPTPRALELASAVREGLGKLELALTGNESAPTETLRTFRIGATDYACMVVIPSLVKRLAKSAPNIDLRVLSSPPRATGFALQIDDRRSRDAMGSKRGSGSRSPVAGERTGRMYWEIG
jgi:Bacterial regulatory helix-turn-helix protein, lysR family